MVAAGVVLVPSRHLGPKAHDLLVGDVAHEGLDLLVRHLFTQVIHHVLQLARGDAAAFVSVEHHDDIEDAIAREKAMKKWNRAWKIRRIEEQNPDWDDLFETLKM